MSLLTILDAELAFGLQPLLDRASLTVQAGDRIGLIGRNGTGKSSLLNTIAGRIELDDGEIKRKEGLSIAMVEQEPALPPAPTLRASLALRGKIETHVSAHDDRERWRIEARLIEYMHRLGLDEAADPAELSGGERKRGALALAFALAPDLMLLDEPTNHLDIDGITLLEELLAKQTLIVITHDRAFLDRVTTRIVELDRGLLRSYPGNYSAWEARRAVELAAERTAARKFDKFWQQEEAWIRRGIEARRTRNAGRVERLERLRVARAARRDSIGRVKLAVDAGERSGKLVTELTDVTKRFGTTLIVDRLSMRILRGDRIGLIGPNGAGKTTLLRLMLGSLEPDQGTVRSGTRVQVAYFDQMRAALDPDKTLIETISPGSDWIEIGGERRHVMTYLGDFLFPPQRAEAPIGTLSGGERNRLLLARLFAQPANLLVLDEPTNDLDIESLELLEATLQQYDGTLLLVSHDRAFLDNVVTQTLVAEGNGVWREYVGGYSDWVRQRIGTEDDASNASNTSNKGGGVAARPAARAQRGKLSYKEQRELIALPAEIELLENEQRVLAERMNQVGYHRERVGRIKSDRLRIEEIEHLIAAKFEQWSALEARSRADQGFTLS
ncbi:MAG: ATP-binding cassette domain-containing protein [Pseudomonadota bacterium]|nr:ATP-binding cassette domain-containing protein [Burkholderiaceae bacterium]MDQ3446203.1 ATP-binding cassette domain-containing protein [Pseudomonadota bacterium]